MDAEDGIVWSLNMVNKDLLSTKNINATILLADNDKAIFSDFVRKQFIFLNHVIIDTCICMFGIVGNCINITVFLKQGLHKSVNLSLFAMSSSDLIGLIFQVWHNFCLNPYLELADLPVMFEDIQLLTAGCPNILMTRLTAWITAYITAERCLSVLIPLKIQRIVTFRKTAVVLLLIFSINFAALLPMYFSAYLGWTFYPGLNRTKIGISYRENSFIINSFTNSAHFYLTLIAFLFVVIFTTVLIISLKKRFEWRRGVASDREQREALTGRQSKTLAMIIAVAGVLIVCYTPGVISSILSVVFVELFWVSGTQSNLCHVVWSFCFLFQTINASVNVVMYYKMSSKFKTTCQEIFPILKNKKMPLKENYI